MTMRRLTKQVKVGRVRIGSSGPVVVQSMLNTDTMNTTACVEQALRIVSAGGELIRITAPGVREAENLRNIHQELRERGCMVPISADIHFLPEAAMVAARYVEKVRINPGNFVGKQASLQSAVYDDDEYNKELQELRKKFVDLLEVCRKYETAIRIGTNHGSLSGRIVSRYGNTPEGMVEATMEFARICHEEQFDQVVISLKSSDCRIMVDAVRLLVRQMEREGLSFPVHLGVTEAGEGEDGRIRSAIGIGTLLNEGLGDTIRISLTEDPEREIPVCRDLIRYCIPTYRQYAPLPEARSARTFIVADVSVASVLDGALMSGLDFHARKEEYPVCGDLLEAGKGAPEMFYTEILGPALSRLPETVGVIVPYQRLDEARRYNRNLVPLMELDDFMVSGEDIKGAVFLKLCVVEDITESVLRIIKQNPEVVLVLSPEECRYSLYRELIECVVSHRLNNRIVLRVDDRDSDRQSMGLRIASQTGGLFLDRLADGLWITAPGDTDPAAGLKLSRDILQSAGVRRYKTEFISCPGCGRTLFDLQEAVRRVKSAISPDCDLKIAVMGCVVNGPGEMGDADYGYVGAGSGKVNLYKGKKLVLKNVPEKDAIALLRQLIQEE